MLISLKKKHIAFAMTPIRTQNSLSDLALVQQLKPALMDYSDPEAIVSINISPQRLGTIYDYISQMPEGMTSTIADEIMNGDGLDFHGLTAQITEGVINADQEFMYFAGLVQSKRESHQSTFANHVEANLNYIQNLNL